MQNSKQVLEKFGYLDISFRTAILIYTEANRQSVTLPQFSFGIK